MFELKGYIKLKSDYSDQVFIGEDRNFNRDHYNKIADDIKSMPMRIMEIGVDNESYLCLAPDGTCLIDVRDKNDVACIFRCCEFMEVLCPPELEDNLMSKIAYASKIHNEIEKRRNLMIERKAPLDTLSRMPSLLRRMVIMNSLMKGKLTDTLYFQYADPNDEVD